MDTRVKLAEDLANALGDALVSAVAYGPPNAKPGVVPSLLVVLDEVSSDNLALMRKPVADALKKDDLGIMTLTENELKRSADVFPIKFRAIRRNGKTLQGKDLVQKMEIRDSHLRLRCEQELKNLSLRLRQRYLQGLRTAKQKASALASSVGSLRQDLAVLAELKEGKSDLSPKELAEVAKGWDLDLSPLDQAEKLADEKKPDDVKADSTYHAFRAMVDQAADIADRL